MEPKWGSLRLRRGQLIACQVLVLVGTVELAKQAADRIKSMHPNMTVDIEQGSLNVATGDADCTVATYQTLLSGDRLSKFDPAKFKCIFVDEAHHAASPAYLRILSRFDSRIQPPEQAKAGIDEETGELVEEPSTEEEAGKVPIVLAQENTSDQDRIAIMGFSATFSRHDGLALNSVFDHIVYHVDFVNMIEQGW
jgi:ATP-dependent helicase IRC3